MGKLVKKILDLLPLDGSKLKIGSLFGIFAVLQQFASIPDIFDLIKLLTAGHLSATAITLILVGWLHKQLKKKYPEDKDL